MAWRCALILILVLLAACHDRSSGSAAGQATKPAADPWLTAGGRSLSVEQADRATIAKLIVEDAHGGKLPLGHRMRDVTVIAFWASWCRPCLDELPRLDELAAAEHDARVAIVAVNLDEADARAAALQAISTRHFALPTVFDPSLATYRAAIGGFGFEIPALAIVSQDGVDEESGYEPGDTAGAWVADHLEQITSHLR